MSEPLMFTRYQAWLTARNESSFEERHGPFFIRGVVVLDTNVLLDLYRYTEDPRSQVLAALRMVAQQHRLWLPHQVGLEFVRNRAKAVEGRLNRLRAVKGIVDDRFQSAVRRISEARDEVAELLREMAHDDATADLLVSEIDEIAIKDALQEWRVALLDHLTALRSAENVTPQHVAAATDPLLPQIAQLFGDRIGTPLGEDETQRLVHHALTYRFPNRIPPGFADQNKSTDLARAGDYLLWEQIIRHVATLPEPRYVLFVSRDIKEDWYEHNEKGKPYRPWPALHDEMHDRSSAELLILTTKDFLQGAQHFLGAQLAAGTYKEVDRVAEEADQTLLAKEFIEPTDVLLQSSDPQPYTNQTVARAPRSPGAHMVLDDGVIIYVGSTGNLRARLKQHLAGHRGSSVLHDRVGRLLDTPDNVASATDIADWLGHCTVRWYEADDPASVKEALVETLNPRFNR